MNIPLYIRIVRMNGSLANKDSDYTEIQFVCNVCIIQLREKTFTTDPRPRVHKETENEDQAQDQTYKLQLLDKKSFKFDEFFTILFGG